VEEISNGGSDLSLDDSEFWKGALTHQRVGAELDLQGGRQGQR